jgi:hypothetical protein
VASRAAIQEKANEGHTGTSFSDAQLIPDVKSFRDTHSHASK